MLGTFDLNAIRVLFGAHFARSFCLESHTCNVQALYGSELILFLNFIWLHSIDGSKDVRAYVRFKAG